MFKILGLLAYSTILSVGLLFSAPGVPILLVLFTAGPVNVSFADADERVKSILQCFFPAQATGHALYNVVTMATPDSSPAGRLPYTWYNTSDQVGFFFIVSKMKSPETLYSLYSCILVTVFTASI